MIKNLSEINTITKEGRLLLTALTKMANECQPNKTQIEILSEIETLANAIHPIAIPNPYYRYDGDENPITTIEQRREFLIEKGWYQMWHDDNWLKRDEVGKDILCDGICTDMAFQLAIK